MQNKPTYEELEKRIKELEKERDKSRETECLLQQSEQRFKDMADLLPLMIYESDLDGNLTYINNQAYKIFGRSLDEPKSEFNVLNAVIPEDLDRVIEDIGKLLSGTAIDNHEFTALRIDGSTFPILIYSSLIYEDDKPVGLRGVVVDITNHKQFEEELLRYEHIVSSTDVHMSFIDKNYIYCAVNEAYLKAHQKSQNELIEMSVADLLGEDIFQRLVKEKLDRCLAGEQIHYQDWFDLSGLGRRYMEVTYRSYQGVDGEVSGVVVSSRDITEHKQAEEALKNNQNFLNSIIEQSPFATWVSDEKGTMIKCNVALEKILNITAEQLIGKYNVFEDEIAIEQGLMPKIRSVFEERKTANFSVEWDANGLGHKDAEKVHIEGTMFPINDNNGNLTNVVNHWIDITERTQAEKKLRNKETQLRRSQKMETVGILAGGIAHEFNNLLFIILGSAELLLMSAEQDDKSFLQEIIETTKRGGNLVKQLMAFSRKSEMNLYTIHLNVELQRIKKMLNQVLPRMIHIDLDLANNLHSINADQGQIEQVILNLCLNAKDAMPDGGSLTIKTENSIIDKSFVDSHPGKPMDLKEDKCVILTISDTGIGMDEKTKAHIFDPFFTTKEIGNGTGLGLSVIYGIVEGHGGHITCESEPDAGTTFKTYFPAANDDQTALTHDKIEDNQLLKGTETILLVDDEDNIINVMDAIFKKFGYTTLSANSGESALEIYTQAHKDIDLIVLDLGMPGMGGKKCLEKLIELDKDVKVIVASGYSDEGSVKDTGEKANAFILKPFSSSKIIKLIRDVLDGK